MNGIIFIFSYFQHNHNSLNVSYYYICCVLEDYDLKLFTQHFNQFIQAENLCARRPRITEFARLEAAGAGTGRRADRQPLRGQGQARAATLFLAQAGPDIIIR